MQRFPAPIDEDFASYSAAAAVRGAWLECTAVSNSGVALLLQLERVPRRDEQLRQSPPPLPSPTEHDLEHRLFIDTSAESQLHATSEHTPLLSSSAASQSPSSAFAFAAPSLEHEPSDNFHAASAESAASTPTPSSPVASRWRRALRYVASFVFDDD